MSQNTRRISRISRVSLFVSVLALMVGTNADAQGRKKTEQYARRTLRDRDKRTVFTAFVVGQGVQAARHSLQLSCCHHPRELTAGGASGDEFVRARGASPTQEGLDVAFYRAHVGIVP